MPGALLRTGDAASVAVWDGEEGRASPRVTVAALSDASGGERSLWVVARAGMVDW